MFFNKKQYSVLFQAITILLLHALILSNVALAIEFPQNHALAPPLATNPPCKVCKAEEAGCHLKIKTDSEVISPLRNEWPFYYISCQIRHVLEKQISQYTLIPRIKKHMRKAHALQELERLGFDIDGIEEIQADKHDKEKITGFSLPIKKDGKLTHKLMYSLDDKDADATFEFKDGKRVYVAIESVDSKQEIEKIERAAAAIRSMRHGALIFAMGSQMDSVLVSLSTLRVLLEDNGLNSLIAKVKEIESVYEAGIWKPMDSIMEKDADVFKSEYVTIDYAETCVNKIKEVVRVFSTLDDKLKDIQRRSPSLPEEINNRIANTIYLLGKTKEMIESRIELVEAISSDTPQAIVNIINEICERKSYVIVENKLARPIEVLGNLFSLKNALANIVNNAMHFAEKRQKKEKTRAEIKVEVIQEKGFVRIDVIDNGEGIPQELLEIDPIMNRPHLFNLNVSQREGGTGLGTTEAWYAIKDMGGTIEVESELDKDTTFTIRLPVRDEKSPKPLPVQNKPIPPSGIKKVFLNGEEASAENVREKMTECSKGEFIFNALIKNGSRLVLGIKPSKTSGVGALVHEQIEYPPIPYGGTIRGVISSTNEISLIVKPLYKTRMPTSAEKKRYRNDLIRLARVFVEHGFLCSFRLCDITRQLLETTDVSVIPQTLSELAKQALSTETPVVDLSSESIAKAEQVQAIRFKDAVKEIKKPTIIALGTDSLPGYDRGKFTKYFNLLNPFLTSIQGWCNDRENVAFVFGEDKELSGKINGVKRERQGFTNAQVLVLSGEETARELNSQKDTFTIGIDNKNISHENYIRLTEMLRALIELSKLSEEERIMKETINEINEDHPKLGAKLIEGLIVFILPEEAPVDYDELIDMYEPEQFA